MKRTFEIRQSIYILWVLFKVDEKWVVKGILSYEKESVVYDKIAGVGLSTNLSEAVQSCYGDFILNMLDKLQPRPISNFLINGVILII